MHAYNTVSAFQPYRLRGIEHQSNDGLLWSPPTYLGFPAGDVVTRTRLLMEGLAVGSFQLHNRSGSTGAHGLGARIPNRHWIAGEWINAAATPFTADTVDAQDTGTSDFPLETTTDNDGFVIASPVKFNAISILVGTASAGGSAVRAVRYSNTAGSDWIALSNLFIHTGATGNYSATVNTDYSTEALIVFDAPTNWGQTAAGGLSGIPAGMYALNVRATTAPTGTAGSATAIEIFRFALLTEGITDNSTLAWTPSMGELNFWEGDGLVALFETSSPGNRASASVRVLG